MVKYEKYISNLKMKVEQQRESRRKQYEDIKERLRQKEEEVLLFWIDFKFKMNFMNKLFN